MRSRMVRCVLPASAAAAQECVRKSTCDENNVENCETCPGDCCAPASRHASAWARRFFADVRAEDVFVHVRLEGVDAPEPHYRPTRPPWLRLRERALGNGSTSHKT